MLGNKFLNPDEVIERDLNAAINVASTDQKEKFFILTPNGKVEEFQVLI